MRVHFYGGRLDGELREFEIEPTQDVITIPAYSDMQLERHIAERGPLGEMVHDTVSYRKSERTIDGCAVYEYDPKGAHA